MKKLHLSRSKESKHTPYRTHNNDETEYNKQQIHTIRNKPYQRDYDKERVYKLEHKLYTHPYRVFIERLYIVQKLTIKWFAPSSLLWDPS